jgi:hypothetical protein
MKQVRLERRIKVRMLVLRCLVDAENDSRELILKKLMQETTSLQEPACEVTNANCHVSRDTLTHTGRGIYEKSYNS